MRTLDKLYKPKKVKVIKATKEEKAEAARIVADMAKFQIVAEVQDGPVWKYTVWSKPEGHSLEVQNLRFGWDNWYEFPLETMHRSTIQDLISRYPEFGKKLEGHKLGLMGS